MVNIKTFGDSPQCDNSNRDPLSSFQKESVERMRTSLLACSLDDPYSARAAIQQVTLLRIYHQVARIIKYLDMMDKIEDKLYTSIDNQLNSADMYDASTLRMLLTVQEKLQKAVIDSNKLLEPYINMEQYPAFESMEVTQEPAKILTMPAASRNALRSNAQAIIHELVDVDTLGDNEPNEAEEA